MGGFEFDLNKVSYANCRNCKFFTAMTCEGCQGNICYFFRNDGNYVPFSVVFSKDMLARDLRDYNDNRLPDDCPYYVQSCLEGFDNDGIGSLVDEEWADYSKLHEAKMSEIDFKAPLFKFVMENDRGFGKWIEEHINDTVWTAGEGADATAFMHLSFEGDGVDYSWMTPGRPETFRDGRTRVRISYMMNDHKKMRWGASGLLKIAFCKALERGANDMYALTYNAFGVDALLCQNGFKGGIWKTDVGNDDDAAQQVLVRSLDEETKIR